MSKDNFEALLCLAFMTLIAFKAVSSYQESLPTITETYQHPTRKF